MHNRLWNNGHLEQKGPPIMKGGPVSHSDLIWTLFIKVYPTIPCHSGHLFRQSLAAPAQQLYNCWC